MSRLAWRGPEIVRAVDEQSGKSMRHYSDRDPGLLLRAMTGRMGSAGYPFDSRLSRRGKEYANELRDIRNKWAHNDELTVAKVSRALDVAEALLREVGADEQAARGRGASAADASRIPVCEPPVPVTPAARLTITAIPTVSYAMAHCRIGVVSEIQVENLGPERRGCAIDLDIGIAAGSLGGPRTMLLDLAANETTILHSPDPILDPAQMIKLDEQAPGEIRAVLSDPDGRELARTSVDVQVLAHNQWTSSPPQLGFEMLAAHVQPNSAAVAALLPQVSDHLGKLTGKPALDGYQSGDPGRVDAIAAAVYEAMRDRDIRYAEPPASWGNGQKVRTPQEVLDGRVGTCLDTALTMAAVLEQAGIGATLWVLPGHIFLGYWRSERTLDTAATADIVPVVNLVEIGDIGLIETTMVTGGPTASRPFAEAAAAPRLRHLGPTSERVHRDHRHCDRAQSGHPAAAQPIGGIGRHDRRHQLHTGSPWRADAGRTRIGRPGARHDPVPARVAGWKNALLDLSLRNRLINYTDRSGFRVDLPGGLLGALEDHVNANRQLTLMASDQVAAVDAARGIRFGRDLDADSLEQLFRDKSAAYIDITAKSYTAKLRYLANKARTIVEETGANNLYLAFGMLRWTFNDRELRSPLVLVPVYLVHHQPGPAYRLAIDEAGMSTPNYCLLEKLRVAFGLEIPGLAEPAEDRVRHRPGRRRSRRRAAPSPPPACGSGSRTPSTCRSCSSPSSRSGGTSTRVGRHWHSNSLVDHLIETPLKPFGDPVTADRRVDLDELAARFRCPPILPSSTRSRGSRRAAPSCCRARRDRQVADHHQPAGACAANRPAGAVRRREAGRTGRRASSGWTPSASVSCRWTCTTKRLGRPRCAPRSSRAGPACSRRHGPVADQQRDLPPAGGHSGATRPVARHQRRRTLAVFGAVHRALATDPGRRAVRRCRRGWWPAHPRRPWNESGGACGRCPRWPISPTRAPSPVGIPLPNRTPRD